MGNEWDPFKGGYESYRAQYSRPEEENKKKKKKLMLKERINVAGLKKAGTKRIGIGGVSRKKSTGAGRAARRSIFEARP